MHHTSSHSRLLRSRHTYESRFIAAIVSMAILLWVTSLVVQPAHGAPIVSKVLSYEDGGQQFPISGLPSSLPFDFRIIESGTPIIYASWLENYSPSDVGNSFFAPPDVIAGATAARSSRTAVVVLEVNGGAFHSTPAPWWLGIPSDHYITAIERVVDNLVITPISENRYTTQFSQRVRIWTEPIPEPRTMVELAIALSCG